ncbi:2493_t:CDS:2, partial [Funneliformis mosseae]
KAGKYNIEDLFSEEFSNSFSVNITPTFKHTFNGSNSTLSQENKKTKTGKNKKELVKETIIQENILHS